MKWLPIVIALFLSIPLSAQDKTAQEYFVEANQAYQAKDFKKYLDRLRKADELMPNHPLLAHGLAKAYALNGRKTRSIQQLKRLAMLDATVDFTSDPDLQSVVGYKGYRGVVNLRNLMLSPEENDELYRMIDTDSLHPESFVLLDDGQLLLGSVRQKKIVKVDSSGRIWDWIETPYSVLGMEVDPNTGHLWAASAAMPEMRDYKESDQGHSVVFEINLETGEIVQGMGFDDGELLGDVELDNESRLWLTNSNMPFISRDNTDTAYHQGAFMRKQYDLKLRHFNLQGLTLNDEETYLYFADYRTGIHRLNIALDKVEPVLANSDFMPIGIDGLYFYQNSLIAIHNGVKPFKVVQYLLDEEGLNIIGKRTINRAGSSLGEPTLGQIKDGYFYYIANSPWGAYDENKRIKADLIPPLAIRRIRLN